ncbi:N-acetylmuramoyl-L-alanine amidase [Erwinia psidii]|uniref:N-acetylmuramoyl-L-alanine amidase n=2 Tax=Erwinia psidii TaxID=69224 RepID=A0A3N6V1F1_9GAMM|nr:N-acetylmuramoyl-L-alanine amidase [Erwinia psidii]RQM38895.1 N-acetylmuramoyl-L-alanine amidase [Erwinia psidii]
MRQSISLLQINNMRKAIAMAVLAVMLTGCATQPAIIEERDGYFASHAAKAVGQNERVRFLVMHYTALDNEHSLNVLTQENVSAHYLIQNDPTFKNGKPVILQLVDENKRAWHAGVSNWNGRSNFNDSSIGIEIVNRGFTDDLDGRRTWYPFSEKQIAAIAALTKDIVHRYQITPDNVVGHADIAPLRKQDPGKLFPWERLAAIGVGAWPDRDVVARYLADRDGYAPVDVKNLQALLKQYGYDQIPQNGMLDEETRKNITAFQMHFRPTDISGNADAETEAIVCALIEKYRST